MCKQIYPWTSFKLMQRDIKVEGKHHQKITKVRKRTSNVLYNYLYELSKHVSTFLFHTVYVTGGRVLISSCSGA